MKKFTIVSAMLFCIIAFLRAQDTAYCTPTVFYGVNGSGISQVEFGQVDLFVNNPTNDDEVYSDYSATMIGDAMKGTNLEVKVTTTVDDYSYAVVIYVDWNQDFDFTDAGEMVYQGLLYGDGTLSAAIPVPLNIASNSNYRMRIAAFDNDYTSTNRDNPCGGINYGCFEDYSIAVLDEASCVAPTVAVGDFSLQGLQYNAIMTIQNTATPESYEYVIVPSNSNTDPSDMEFTTTTSTSIDISGLNPNTEYIAYVRANCGNGDYSLWASAIFFTGYCTPQGFNMYGSEGITHVTFGQSQIVDNITQTTDVRYADYSSMIGDAARGTDLEVSFTRYTDLGWNSKIYVDWNNNLQFEESEIVFSDQSTDEGPYTTSFTISIPEDRPLGDYRMRIVASEYGSNAPCVSQSFSEVEDYTIRVVEAPTCQYPRNIVVSDISHNSANISWTPGGEETSWNVLLSTTVLPVEYLDTVTSFQTVSDTTYAASALLSNTVYYCYVRAVCGGEDGASVWSRKEFQTISPTVNVPFVEDFSGAMPDVLITTSGLNGWAVGTADGNPQGAMYISQDGGEHASYDNESSSNSTAAFFVDFGNFAQYELSFDWKSMGESSYDAMRVYLLPLSIPIPTAWSGTNWIVENGAIPVGGMMSGKSTWQHEVMTIPADVVAGNIYKLVFMWKNDDSMGDNPAAMIDNISILKYDCSAPDSITLDSLSTTTAKISWRSVGVNAWKFEYRKSGDQNWITEEVANPYKELTGLQSSSLYQVRISAKCSEGSYSIISEYQFRTECADLSITDAMYEEDFQSYADETVPSCWVRTQGQGNSPRVYGGMISFLGDGNQIISTPRFVESANLLELQFDIKKNSYFDAGSFEVGLISDENDSTTFVTVTDLTSNIAEVGMVYRMTVRFPNTPDSMRRIAFRQLTNEDGYYFVDNVNIHLLPSCASPENLSVMEVMDTTADLSWTAVGTETNWYIEYKAQSATSWQYTTSQAASVTLTGLQPSTVYQARVKAVCAEGDSSLFSNTVTFRTECGTINMPFVETFSNYNMMPPAECWTLATGLLSDGNPQPTTPTYYTWKYASSNPAMTSSHAKVELYGTQTQSWLMTPMVNIDSEDAMLEFDMSVTDYNGSDEVSLGNVAYRFIVLFSENAGTTWTDQVIWTTNGSGDYDLASITNRPQHIQIPMSQYVGKSMRVAFYAESLDNTTTDRLDVDIHIDSIRIGVFVAEPPIVRTLPVTDITSTSANFHKSVTQGTFEVVEQGFYYKPTFATAWNLMQEDSVATNLVAGTQYEVYAYAIAAGITYSGDTLEFTTDGNSVVHPTVVTVEADNVSYTSATLHSIVSDDSSEPVVAKGWKYKKATDTNWLNTTDSLLTNLLPNTQYEFYAFATTDLNPTGYNGSTLVFSTLAHTAPIVTMDSSAIVVECNQMALNKSVVAGSEEILSEGWKYMKVGGVSHDFSEVTDASGMLANLEPQATYKVFAYAITAYFPMVTSDTIEITTPQCSSIDLVGKSIMVYPNPVKDELRVFVEAINGEACATILDMQGKVVGKYSISDSESTINVEALAEGTYFIQIQSGNDTYSERLIIKR